MFRQRSRFWSAQVAPGWGRKRTRNAPPPGLLTVTGESARIEGKFQIAAALEVECEIAGELEIGGRLTIGEKGSVRGDVRTVDAVIRGVYEGDLVASGQVEIAPSGRVTGSITSRSLVIARGGVLNGTVTRIEEERPARSGGLAVEGSRRGGGYARSSGRRPFGVNGAASASRAAAGGEPVDGDATTAVGGADPKEASAQGNSTRKGRSR